MLMQGNALAIPLKDQSVQCVVTSPPYWGLRDYGVAGQLGSEPSPEEYVANMMAVFAEVWRVLRDDGTLWVNMGDCYVSGTTRGRRTSAADNLRHGYWNNSRIDRRVDVAGLAPKQMVGMPWRLAFALQGAGWYLRRDIIWAKPNPMPESVKDRPTSAHEYIFLLAKSPRYFFDQDAVREPSSPDSHARYARGRSLGHKWANGGPGNQTIAKSFERMRPPAVNPKAVRAPTGWDTGLNGAHGSFHRLGREGRGSRMHFDRDPRHGDGVNPKTLQAGRCVKQNESFSAAVKDLVEARNIRSVWTVPLQGYSDAHFATFPENLVKPCILAGCPAGGVVFDPFVGSGTTVKVAQDLGRVGVGLELSGDYLAMARRRTAQQGLGI